MKTGKNPRLEAVLYRLGRLYPRVIDLSLERSRRLLCALGRPESRLPPAVHIAGTNGKGSTLAFLRAIAEAAGLSVHVYTSPHLVRFAERIRIAGRLLDDEGVADLLERVERRNEGQEITFFEATTAAAMLAFAETPADLCLIETGMGGRCDATNVLARPALTLISSLSLDHKDFLGESLKAIAFEKTGIMKRGAPCLSVSQEEEAMAVIVAEAEKRGAPLRVEGRDWRIDMSEEGVVFSADGETLLLPPLALPGRHQLENAGLAIAAARVLADLPGLPKALADPRRLAVGLENAVWPARLQRLRKGPLVDLSPEGWELWLDGGHNPGAGRALAQQAADWSDRPLYLMAGMLNTKDARGFFAPLAFASSLMRGVPIPGEEGSRTAEETALFASEAGFADARPAADLVAAMDEIRRNPGPARILICGSLHLAGVVLAENE
ncbi:bifunctional folylpolyglutamate synthase/dihydrofolate synthase [Alphaproteobacteria bacterium]|nr:bifunctional folylpolyglutamate synthase/dihydrofolate synthase [Alphaproteobacteria bacterium]